MLTEFWIRASPGNAFEQVPDIDLCAVEKELIGVPAFSGSTIPSAPAMSAGTLGPKHAILLHSPSPSGSAPAKGTFPLVGGNGNARPLAGAQGIKVSAIQPSSQLISKHLAHGFPLQVLGR
jgi:hypothetical protein